MRNSTVIAMGMALAVTLPATAVTMSPLKMMKDAGTRVFHKESVVKDNESKAAPQPSSMDGRKTEGPMRMSEMARKMKPGKTKAFGRARDKWELEDTYTYTYDSSGNVIVEESAEEGGGFVRTVSEYNANNKVTFRESKTSMDGVNFENNKKSEFEYDPILTGVITYRGEWLWMDGDWRQVSNNYKRIITRDDAGNITSVVIAVLYNGIYDPTQKLDITYGADGKATTITEQILGYDGRDFYWQQGVKISDIVWDRTDGQIYGAEDLFIGNNRIGSAHYVDSDDLDMNVTVEYADDSDAYVATMTMTMDGMTVTATSEYTPLENDGYIGVGTTYFMGEEMYSTREEYRYDDWGLMTLSYEGETEDGESYAEGSVGEVEYDQEGKPLTYTIGEFFTDEKGEWIVNYVVRAEYSDYVDVTSGVSSVGVPEGSGKCYDLNGIPVLAPEKGRIVVRDGKAFMVR